MKSYALPGEGNKPFLAYLIPVDGGGDDKVDGDQARDAREGEYEWVREYLFDANVNNSGVNPTFLLQFEGGECKYLDLNTRLKCNKRTRSSQGSDISKDFIRPSKITVVMGESTEQEDQEREKRLQEFRGVEV